MRFSEREIRQMADDLRKPTYGHGAFGEPERTDPPAKDIKLANMLDDLLEELKCIR